MDVEGLGRPGARRASGVRHLDLGELAARLPAPGHGLHVQRLGGRGVVAVVHGEGHADGPFHADIVAGRHRALDLGIHGGRAAGTGARAVLEVDQRHAVAVLGEIPVVIGRQGEVLLCAISLDQLDVGHIEAQVLELGVHIAAAQPCDGGASLHGRRAGHGGEVQRDAAGAGRCRWGVTAATSTGTQYGEWDCRERDGQGIEARNRHDEIQ